MTSIASCKFDDIKHFDGRAPRNQSHIYEGKTPIDWHCIEVDGEIVGCIGLLYVGKEARIRGWFVDKPYRGRGLGGELLRYAAETALLCGAERVEIKTAQKEIALHCGWESTGKEYPSFGGAQFIKRG